MIFQNKRLEMVMSGRSWLDVGLYNLVLMYGSLETNANLLKPDIVENRVTLCGRLSI